MISLKRVTREEIERWARGAEDYEETQAIKRHLSDARSEREPLFLAMNEFDEVARWKLRGQRGRVERRLADNSDNLIQT